MMEAMKARSLLSRASRMAVLLALVAPPFTGLAQLFPKAALRAKSVVILNDTHAFAVQQSAEAELNRWGRMHVVSRIESADVVLSFSNRSAADGTPTVVMTASTRDNPAPFFKTFTREKEAGAGHDCTTAFENAWTAEAERAGMDLRKDQ
jgi:hypothetical protein